MPKITSENPKKTGNVMLFSYSMKTKSKAKQNISYSSFPKQTET